MPIDPRIALGVQQQQMPTFLDLAGQAAQVRNLQAQPAMQQQQMRLNDLRIQNEQQNLDQQGLAMDAAKRKEAGIAALSELWGQYGDDDNQIVAGLNQRGFADMAQAFTEDRAKVKKDVFAAEKDKIETQAKQVSLAGQILGSINDEQTLVRGVGQALANGLLDAQSAQEWLAGGWNEQTAVKVAQVRQQALTAQQQIEKIRQEAKDAEDLLRAPDERKKLAAEATRAEQLTTGNVPMTNFEKAKLESEKRQAEATERYRNARLSTERRTADIIQQTGLSNQQGQRVLSVSNQFDNEPIVKRYSVVKDAEDFVNRLGTSAADDQGLVYAFAKVMDPDSAVRGEEYNVIKQYAQSWLETFGFNAQRILSGTEFLTPEARKQLKNVIKLRSQAAEKSYKGAYDEYARKVGLLAGVKNGAEFLTDYSKVHNKSSPGKDQPKPSADGQAKPKPTKRFNPATGQVEDIR